MNWKKASGARLQNKRRHVKPITFGIGGICEVCGVACAPTLLMPYSDSDQRLHCPRCGVMKPNPLMEYLKVNK